MTYFVDFGEMDTEELWEEFCRMKTELLTLTEFLVANFGNDIRAGDGVPGPSSVEVAVRLLGELKQHGRWIKALRLELKACRQQVRTLMAAVVELSDWHIETQEGETNDGISL